MRTRNWGLVGLALTVASALAACDAGSNGSSDGVGAGGGFPIGGSSDQLPPSGVAGSGAIGMSTGGAVGIVGIGSGGAIEIGVGGDESTGDFGNGNVTCSLPTTQDPVFLGQMLTEQTAGRGELYAWASDEQAAALRSDQVLLPAVTPEPGAQLALLALSSSTDVSIAKIAAALRPQLSNARVAWPEPWALRIGPGGEDNGSNLVRIVLNPDAWIAVVKGGTIQVLDLSNQPVLLTDAATTPERIGAIFNERDGFESGPSCTGALGSGVGFRQFLVTNLAMVQEWSLGTQQINDHLQANIDQLSQFLARIRPCPDQSEQQFWNQQVVCSWDAPISLPIAEQFAYRDSLATPIENYLGAPAQLGALIALLQGDLFTPDPMVVTTGSP